MELKLDESGCIDAEHIQKAWDYVRERFDRNIQDAAKHYGVAVESFEAYVISLLIAERSSSVPVPGSSDAANAANDAEVQRLLDAKLGEIKRSVFVAYVEDLVDRRLLFHATGRAG